MDTYGRLRKGKPGTRIRFEFKENPVKIMGLFEENYSICESIYSGILDRSTC